MAPLPFTFAIPLVGRAAARDFARVEALLALTLRSLLAQDDPDFRVLILGHDRPAGLPDDSRIVFARAEHAARPADAANNDAGAKRHALAARVLAEGGGLLMLVDGDDWIGRGAVSAARALLTGADAIGAVIERGRIVAPLAGLGAPLPHPALFAEPFHALCGSSVVLRLDPGADEPLRRNPFAVLRDHHAFAVEARARGARVATLPVEAAYVVDTGVSHSEEVGPFAGWRRDLARRLRRVGRPLDDGALAPFGLDRAALGPLAGVPQPR